MNDELDFAHKRGAYARPPAVESIGNLSLRIPAGGWTAVEAGDTQAIYEALIEMETRDITEYQTLPWSVLDRVYKTSEDVNYHTVAGLAWKTMRDREEA